MLRIEKKRTQRRLSTSAAGTERLVIVHKAFSATAKKNRQIDARASVLPERLSGREIHVLPTPYLEILVPPCATRFQAGVISMNRSVQVGLPMFDGVDI